MDDALRRALFRRSGGQCECTRRNCPVHAGRRRCSQMLCTDVWKIHKLQKRGSATLRNVLALCPACHVHVEARVY